MKLRYLAVASAFVLAVAACSGGGSASSSPAAPSAPASAGAGVQRIAVKLTDGLRMDPAELAVTAGQPVTFVVTNTGAIEHEFFLGDSAAQDAHEQEMMSGGMTMDEPDGIALKAGESKELTHTFPAPGTSLAGCHVSGHYTGGMKATITISG